jgi:hypothetical protein
MLMRTFCVAVCLIAAAQALGGQNVVVVLDDSGSMQDSMQSDRRTRKIDAAKQALLTVLDKLPEDARMGLVVLNGGGPDHWMVRLGPVDAARTRGAVQRVYANGGTPLGEIMKAGTDALLAQREEDRYGTYKLLVVTDGEATDQELVEAYLPDILSRGIVVDVIGVDMRQDHSLATRVHTYRRADDQASLQQAISEVVLGETAAGPGDAGESDFELLVGLPNEVATAALDAFSNAGNQPIGRKAAPPIPVATTPAGAMIPPADFESGGGVSFFSMLSGCCGIVCVGVLVLAVLVLVVSSKKQ